MVRLGAGGLDGRALTPAAMAGGLEALSKFRRLADSHKVDEIIAAATSATREAENGGDFLATVRDRTGIVVRVISGAEEARLIHIAATYGIDLGEAPRRGHRHRRRQRRDHARRRARAGARQELQGRRDPAHRAVRPRRPDRPARRAAAGGTHRSGNRRRTSTRSSDAATSASSARRGRSSASGASRSPLTAATSSTTCTTGPCRPSPSTRFARRSSPPIRRRACRWPGWIRAAPTWRWPAPCCSTPSSAASAPTRSRCARWPCAKG